MKELGREIRKGRQRLGLSQTELGDRVGRGHAQISNLERGITERPPAELLTALATELGDDPERYLRLAGRVSLTAAGVAPIIRAGLPPDVIEAIAAAVAAAQAPLVARIDQLLEELARSRSER